MESAKFSEILTFKTTLSCNEILRQLTFTLFNPNCHETGWIYLLIIFELDFVS